MDAGKRDQKVTIETKTGTETGFGNIADTWSTTLSRWAAVKGARGSEGQPEGVPTYAGTFTFTFAKPTAIVPGQRIGWKGRKFNITFIDDSALDEVVVTAVDGQQVGA